MMTQEKKGNWDTAGILLMVIIITLVWSICVLSVPASALTTQTIEADNVAQYSMTANTGDVIYQIMVDSLPLGTNQTHILNWKGATFLLDIRTSTSWYVFDDFWVNLTYPNGTIASDHLQVQRASDGTYKTHIQPAFTQLQEFNPMNLKVDLYVGLNPVKADQLSFTYPITSTLPFTSASGEFSGETTNVFGYECSEAAFMDSITNYDKLKFDSVSNLAQQAVAWSWPVILSFIGVIPILGPQLVTMLDVVGNLFGTLIFWIVYVATHFYLVLIGGETILCVFAFLLAGKRPKPEKFINNMVNYHVMVGYGFLFVVMTVWHGLLKLAQVAAQILQALHLI